MKACVASEERSIIRQVGSKRTIADAHGPLTREEKKASAEWNLRRGLCDKVYYGEEYCAQWKQEKWRVLVDEQTQLNMEASRAARWAMCPRPGGETALHMSCEKAKTELEKRYALDEMGSMLVGALFSPWVGPPMKRFAPVNLGRGIVPVQGAGKLALYSSQKINTDRVGVLGQVEKPIKGKGVFLSPVQLPVQAGKPIKPTISRIVKPLTTTRRPVSIATPRPMTIRTRTRLVTPFTTIIVPGFRPQ